MNFINDRELALRFKNGEVLSRERLIYFILFILIYEASSAQIFEYIFDDYSKGEYDTHMNIIFIILTVIGTIVCYVTNKKCDDKEFIERYVCIGFPVTVRMLIFTALLSVVDFILYELNDMYFKFSLLMSVDVLAFAVSFCAITYFFWRLNSSIKLAASAT